MNTRRVRRGHMYRTRRKRGVLPALVLVALGALAGYMVTRMPDAQVLRLPAVSQEIKYVALPCTLPRQTWYVLELGAFETEDAAKAVAQAYQNRGAGALVAKRDQKYCVWAAAYESREAALKVQENLSAWHQVESYVTSLKWPGVTLQLSGEKTQAEALATAYDFAFQTGMQWQQAALKLDEGTLSRPEAEEMLSSHLHTAETLYERLLSAFGRQDAQPEAVLSMTALMKSMAQSIRTAMEAQGDVRFGAQVKYAYLDVLWQLSQHAFSLAAQLSSP